MIRKYHNHKLQTNSWHREEGPHNNHATPGRLTKQNNQLCVQSWNAWTQMSSQLTQRALRGFNTRLQGKVDLDRDKLQSTKFLGYWWLAIDHVFTFIGHIPITVSYVDYCP